MQSWLRCCKLSRAWRPNLKAYGTPEELIISEPQIIAGLRQCSKAKDIEFGKHIHQTVITQHGLKSNIVIANTLVEMYRKCESMHDASKVFEEMSFRNVVTWTCLVHGFVENGESFRALELFSMMDCEPNHVTYVAALKACACIASGNKQLYLEKGIAIHNRLKGSVAESNILVSNSLIDMYSKFGTMSLAKQVFDNMSERDVVTWTCLIRGYVDNGQSVVGLQYFKRMDCDPNHVTFTVALQACSSLASENEIVKRTALETGVHIHEQVRKLSLDSNVIVSNTLVDMYSKHGEMTLARNVFDNMKDKDVISWTCLILGYVENGRSTIGLELFRTMDCQPNHVTFVAALKACAGMASQGSHLKGLALESGKDLHKQVINRGCESLLVVANTLMDMYCKCREMSLARKVFETIKCKTTASWTSLILGYVESGQGWIALELFEHMDSSADHITYAVALKACMSLATESHAATKERALKKGVEIHEQITRYGLNVNSVIANTLVAMYGRFGKVAIAKKVFDEMACKNVVSWNCLLQGYIENEQEKIALDLFGRMDCKPDHVSYLIAFKACTKFLERQPSERLVILEKGIRIHEQARRGGSASDIIVANALVDMYSKCGDMILAKDVFESMVCKDVVTWNSFMQGYVDNGESAVALVVGNGMDVQPDHVTYVVLLRACAALFSECSSERQTVMNRGCCIHKKIKERGFDSSIIVSNTLIDMYSKFGNMQLARSVFDKMAHRDTVTWNCLIAGYVENGESAIALDLFNRLEFEPDYVTFVAALKACSSITSENDLSRQMILEKGLEIHSHIKRRGCELNLIVSNSLVDMYTKCGCMQRARDVFEKTKQKNIVTWTCLMLGYVENDQSSATLELFNMLDCEPDCLAYVAVLKACGSLTALEFGRSIHSKVCKLGLEVDAMIATTLVDFYCRCGCLSTANEVFMTLHSPNIVSWNALLTGYSSLGDQSEVISLTKKIQEAGVHFDAITYVCILSACNHGGMLLEGMMYFKSMQEHGIVPSVKHYTCMVDMLGRANMFEEALLLVRNMPFKANAVTWMALLDACRIWSNINVARLAFDAIVLSGDQSHFSAAHALMHDILCNKKMTV